MSKLLLLILDLVFYIVILVLVVSLRNWSINTALLIKTIKAMLPFFPLVTLVFYIFSFYDRDYMRRTKIQLPSLLPALFINISACATLLYFISGPLALVTPKTILIAALLLYHFYIYYSREILFNISISRNNIIILGKSKTLEKLKKLLQKSKEYTICAAYDTISHDIDFDTKNIDFAVIPHNLLTDDKAAWNIISKQFIYKAVTLRTDLELYEDLLRKTPTEGIKDVVWLLSTIGAREQNFSYDIFKKIIGFCLALCLALFFMPLGVIIYFAIKFIDKMPPLFTQERVGRLEKIIYIYKFRTMRPGTQEITKLGRILRTLRLDEIPQLINILKGELSLVGPRPIWTDEYNFLQKHIPDHGIRSILKPGITGWAQLNFKAPPTYCISQKDVDTDKFEAAFNRFSYDIWYIKNRSLSLDIEILLKTAKRMFIKDKHIA